MAGTAAKIELLKYDGRWFLRNEIGENVRDEKGWTIFFKSEAEALEKAAKLREWEEKESGRSEARDQKYDRNLDRRPVETRPPAPRAMPHVDDETGTQCADTCWCKTSEPVEQAAPPRPRKYTMFRNKRFGTWSIAFNGEALISGLSKEDAEKTLKRYNENATAAPEREPQRSEVKPNEAQSQKSAAIEQARPQPPHGYWEGTRVPRTEPAAAEPAPERTPPQCSDVWHFQDAPCVCAEREKALLKDGWYIQEVPMGIATRFVLWHQSPGYETGTLGSSKGHMDIDATVAFLLRKLTARAVAVPEPAQNRVTMSYCPIHKTIRTLETETYWHCDKCEAEPAAQQGDCRSDCIRHQSCIRQRETRTDNLQTQAEPAPTPSLLQLLADWMNLDTSMFKDVHPEFADDTWSKICKLVNKALAEASALGEQNAIAERGDK